MDAHLRAPTVVDRELIDVRAEARRRSAPQASHRVADMAECNRIRATARYVQVRACRQGSKEELRSGVPRLCIQRTSDGWRPGATCTS